MYLLALGFICSIACMSSVTAKLWNPATDPLPPLQPKEMGVQTYNIQYYTLVNTGEVVLDIRVAGYEFFSYLQKLVVAQVSGQSQGNPPTPLMQYSYNNYNDPDAYGSLMLAYYDTQTCFYGNVEGGSSYPGYDYYQSTLLGLYYSNIPVQFEYVTLPDYGLCLRYSALMPWSNPALPRALTYTVTFQNSTGYLIEYDLTGTEYCCPGANFGCPNSGLCPDGSAPVLTLANTNQTLYGYQIFQSNSWPSGFFSNACPFSQDNDDDKNGLAIGDALAILFALLFTAVSAALAVQIYRNMEMHRKMNSLVTANKIEMSDNMNKL